VNRGSKERISETQLAGGQVAGLDQTNAATKAAPLSVSNRYTRRVEHDATHRKQRIGCISTRHGNEEPNRRIREPRVRPGKPMSAQ
jgi:hypothetical protein